MKIRTSKIGAVLAALSMMGLSSVAMASSHREAPAISDDPAADNTDTYAFVDSANKNLVVIANYIGLELPEGGPNWAKFSDDVRYEIHIARGPSKLDDALTYHIKFKTAKPKYIDPTKLQAPAAGAGQEFFAQLTASGAFNQTYTVTKLVNGKNPEVVAKDVPVPPPNVGPTTNLAAYQTGGMTYEQFFVDSSKTIGALTSGGKADGRVFAGPRDDPFWVDLGGVFDLARLRLNLGPGADIRDSIQYLNVHSIALEIPIGTASGGAALAFDNKPNAAATVGVWASASRRKVTVLRRKAGYWNGSEYEENETYGDWVQVSRLGLPLINETVIGLQEKDYWNHLTPSDDAYFVPYYDNLVIVRDAEAVGLYDASSPLPNAGALEGALPGISNCVTKAGGIKKLETGRAADLVPVVNLGVDASIPGFDHVAANNQQITSFGDVIRVDLNQGQVKPFGGPGGVFPNGRRLTDNVVDIEVAMLTCGLLDGNGFAGFALASPQGGVPCGPTANEITFKTQFPYVQAPWEGWSASPRPANK